VLCGFRPWMGAQFHLEVPLVETQQKAFKVSVALLAEKGRQDEKQAAELSVELMRKQGNLDSFFSSKVAKGHIEGRFEHSFNKHVKVSGQFLNSDLQGSVLPLEIHLKGKDFTASLGYHHAEMRDQSEQILSMGYLQKIAPKFALGTQCQYAVGNGTSLNFLGQYKNLKGNPRTLDQEGNIASLTLSQHSLCLGYSKLVQPGISLVSEFKCEKFPPGHPAGKPYGTTCQAGVRYMGTSFQYHCIVDSGGTVSANLIQNSVGPTVMLSGTMNHWTNQSRFGIGLKFTPGGF